MSVPTRWALVLSLRPPPLINLRPQVHNRRQVRLLREAPAQIHPAQEAHPQVLLTPAAVAGRRPRMAALLRPAVAPLPAAVALLPAAEVIRCRSHLPVVPAVQPGINRYGSN